MKLFENGVGRPSNEIKKKRKIFIFSIITLCVVFLLTLSFTLTNINTKKLKGSYQYMPKGLPYLKLNGYSLSFTDDCNLFIELGLEDTKKAGIRIKKLHLLDEDTGYYIASSNSHYSKVSGKTIHENYKFDKDYIEKALSKDKNGKKLVFVLEFDNYKSDNANVLNSFVFPIELNAGMVKNIKACKKTVSKKLSMSCPSEAYINKEFSCSFSGQSVDYSEVKVTIGGSNSLASGYKSSYRITSSSPNPIRIKYTSNLFKNYKKYIKLDSNGNEYINAKITATKSGYSTVAKTVKIYKTTKKVPAEDRTVWLECPKSAVVNQEFECSTHFSDVIITVGGAKSLASGYTSTFTTSFFDKIKTIKYTDKLFINNKDNIKKDSNGEYINAKITAASKGYRTTTKYVKIYKSVTKTSGTRRTVALSCPSSAKVGEKIVCKTNQSGVVIRTSNPGNLASGYTEKFTTTSSDYTKSLSYTKAGTYYVKASKSGYNSVTKKIKVTNTNASSNKKLVLTCPSSVYVNEPIICTTNMAGVTLRGSNAGNLASGISDRFVTTASDMTKTLKYTKAGTYYVKASKSGYGEVKKAITVKNRATQTTVNKNAGKGVTITVLSISTPDGLFADKNDKIFKIRLDKKESKVKYYTYVVCNNLSECTREDSWDYVKKTYGSGAVTSRKTANVGFTDTLTIRTNSESVKGKTYYLRVATYDKDNASNMMHKAVFQLSVNSSNQLSVNLLPNTAWFK